MAEIDINQWFEKRPDGGMILNHEKALQAILGYLVVSDEKLLAIDKRTDLTLVEKVVCGSEVAAPTMISIRRVVHLALGLGPLREPPSDMIFPTGPERAEPIEPRFTWN